MRSYFVLPALAFGTRRNRWPQRNPGHTGTTYGKTGPLGWGKLDPAYQACSKGHEQSPIDIRGARLNKSPAAH